MKEEKVFDRRTIIKIIIGTALGVLGLWLAFRGVSFQELGRVLSRTNPWLAAAGVAVVVLNVAVLTLRWWVMLVRDWEWEGYAALLGGVYLGQMFNILIPARLGELARIYFVSERVEVTKSRLLGSLVLEKVIDIITFGIALVLLITALSLPPWVDQTGGKFVLLAAVSLAVMIALGLWGDNFLQWSRPVLNRLPGEWAERLSGILRRALRGFESLHSWRRQVYLWGLAVLSLFLSTLTNFVALKALGMELPFTAALFVLIVIQVGNAPPSAPGKIGVFHYLAVLALSAFQVDKGQALAYGVLLYLVALVPKILVGLGVLVFSRWKLPELNFRFNKK